MTEFSYQLNYQADEISLFMLAKVSTVGPIFVVKALVYELFQNMGGAGWAPRFLQTFSRHDFDVRRASKGICHSRKTVCDY